MGSGHLRALAFCHGASLQKTLLLGQAVLYHFFHRGPQKKKGEYFGPYPSAWSVRESLRSMQRIFPVRQCEDSYYRARSRPCLQYQMQRCSAPCVEGYVSDEEYNEQVNFARLFLKGKNQRANFPRTSVRG